MAAYPKTIVFVRHGESEGNLLSVEERTKFPVGTNFYKLTDRGCSQARITGEWLREHFPNPDAVFRSYYERTSQTAALCYPDRKIYCDHRLAEANRGIWHVMSEEEIAKKRPEEIELRRRVGDYLFCPSNGENWPMIEQRVSMFRNSLRNRYSGKTVVLFGHGHWHLVWVGQLNHWLPEELMRKKDANEVVANASVTVYKEYEEAGRSRLKQADYIVPWEGKI